MNSRRGFMFVDALIALCLLAAIGLVLVAVRGSLATLDHRNADRATAVRAAETYLVEHAGPTTRPAQSADAPPTTMPATPPTTTPAESPVTLSIVPLPTTAPAGWQWVSVRADVRGRVGEVIGLVRSENR